MLAYGVAFALAANGTLHRTAPKLFVCDRLTDVTRAVQTLDAGGPPLVARGPSGGYYPIGYTDDVGPYLYLSWLGHLTHTSDAIVLHQWLYVGLMSAALALFPLLLAVLFDSLTVGVIAPFLLLWLVVRVPDVSNEYWIGGWCAALCVPALAIAARASWRTRVALLLAVALVAGVAESLRSASGLGIVAAAFGVAALLEREWRRKLVLSVAVALLFWATSTQIVATARAVAEARVGGQPLDQAFRDSYGGTSVSSRVAGTHVFWHSAYIGLGFGSNRYSINYWDGIAAQYAHSVDPTASYGGPRYATILRKRYLHLLVHDPGFVLGVSLAKARTAASDALTHSPALLLLLPMMLLLGPLRRRMRRLILICLPALLVALAGLVLIVPLPSYEGSWLMLTRLLVVLGLGWLTASVAPELRRALSRRREGLTLREPGRLRSILARTVWPYVPGAASWAPRGRGYSERDTRSARAQAAAAARAPLAAMHAVGSSRRRTALATVLVVETCALALGVGASTANRNSQFSLAASGTGTAPAFSSDGPRRSWSFAGGLPSDWLAQSGTRLRPSTVSTTVQTTRYRFGNELVVPVTMPAGSFQVLVQGRIRGGGMSVSVQDARHAIASSSFTDRTVLAPRRGYGVAFTLSGQDEVQITLSNWSRTNRPSTWELRQVTLGASNYVVAPTPIVNGVQQCPSAAASAYAALATPAPVHYPGTATLTARLGAWSLDRGRPRSWLVEPGLPLPTTRAGRSGDLLTTQSQFGYQLVSPRLNLQRGRYVFAVRGRIEFGGLSLLAVDANDGSRLAAANYGESLPHAGSMGMTVALALDQPRAVRFVLANDAAHPGVRSRWRLGRATLERTT